MKKSNKKKANVKMSKKTKKTNRIRKKIYFSFNFRLFLTSIFFILFFVFGLLFILNSLDFNDQISIGYTEKSNLDYKVYLKENEFYETPYLSKDMLYVASLIDNINIDFNYSFTSSENLDLDFNYKIVGQLQIGDDKNNNIYFKKEYVLLEDTMKQIVNNNQINISENINVDYDYYNNLANNFKMSYGLDTISNLNIYLIITKNNDNKNFILNNTNLMSIVIPLSEKSVNIEMEYNEINNSSNIISQSNVIIDNIIYLVVAVIFIIISIVMLIKLIRLCKLIITKRNNYDKYINKLLKEYDRLIVETSTLPFINSNNVIKIDKFQELLDVRDNLKLPIMYCTVTKHQKCYFYIMHGSSIYLNTVKAVDLE